MAELTELLGNALSGDNVSRLADQIGADPETVSKAVSAAMPMIVGGLAKNALGSQEGRESLSNALDRDHEGGLLDNLGDILGAAGGGAGLGGLLGSFGSLGGSLGGLLGASGGRNMERTLDGEGILAHALGQKRSAVEQGVAKASGLDLGLVAKLLPMLAPIVMGALGKVKKERGLDASEVADLLNSERKELEQNVGSSRSKGLMDLLDANDDGSMVDELASIGTMLADSGLFGRR